MQQPHEQRALRRHTCRRAVVQHLEELDGVLAAGAAQDFEATLFAAAEDHAAPPGQAKLSRCALLSASSTYLTTTRKVLSSASTSTAFTAIRWPRFCCSAPWISIWAVAASAVLLGSNTIASRPPPKSGRMTRSPDEVNSTCSMRSRT